jgi:hypothetical protein
MNPTQPKNVIKKNITINIGPFPLENIISSIAPQNPDIIPSPLANTQVQNIMAIILKKSKIQLAKI